MKRSGFGVLSFLIVLLIISIILAGVNDYKGFSPFKNSVNTNNIQKEVDEKVYEIQEIRKQVIEFNEISPDG